MSAGRLDWWNIKEEHTPYQWACQRVIDVVSPYGPRRDDLRAAFNTASVRVGQAQSQVKIEEVRAIIDSLVEYLPCEQQEDGLEYDPEVMKRMKGG